MPVNKPTYPVEIDWTHPLARGLVGAAIVINGRLQVIHNASVDPAFTETGVSVSPVKGQTGITGYSTSNYALYNDILGMSPTGDFSLVVGFRCGADANDAAIIDFANSGSTSENMILRQMSGGKVDVYARGGSGAGLTSTNQPAIDVSDGELHQAIFATGVKTRLALDGIHPSNWYTSTLTRISSGTNRITSGRAGDSTPSTYWSNANNALYYVYVYDRSVIEDGDYTHLYDNPYQMLKPQGWAANDEYEAIYPGLASGIVAINIASATNSAFGINVIKTKSLGLATTANTGQALTVQRSYSIGLSSETNSGFTFNLQKDFSISQAIETNSGFTIATDTGVAINQAIETNSSFTTGINKLKTLGLPVETNSGFSVAIQKYMAIGFDQEVNSGFSLVADKTKSISQATEINSGFVVVADGATPVGQATEINTSFTVGRLKNSVIGLSSEINSGFAAVAVKSVAISIATEINSGFGFLWSKIMTIGQAIETNSGISIIIPGAMGWREVYQANVYINRGAQSNCYITRSKQDDVSLGFTAHQEAGL